MFVRCTVFPLAAAARLTPDGVSGQGDGGMGGSHGGKRNGVGRKIACNALDARSLMSNTNADTHVPRIGNMRSFDEPIFEWMDKREKGGEGDGDCLQQKIFHSFHVVQCTRYTLQTSRQKAPNVRQMESLASNKRMPFFLFPISSAIYFEMYLSARLIQRDASARIY